MMAQTMQHIAIEEPKVNAEFSFLTWEPYFDTGELWTLGAIFRYQNMHGFMPIMSKDLLVKMYLENGDVVYQNMIENLNTCAVVADSHGMAEAISAVKFPGFDFTAPMGLFANNEQDLFKQIVLHCGLGNL